MTAGATASRAEPPSPALATHLAYVATGDEVVDRVSRQGLTGLSHVVSARTSAQLAEPVAVTPGRDELAFYPLLYWAVTQATDPTPAELAALDDYMAHGGLLVIDTRGGAEAEGGGDPGFDNPGAAALRRIGTSLHVPPLQPLGIDHVLARSFYLLREYPGRVVGEPVWDRARRGDGARRRQREPAGGGRQRLGGGVGDRCVGANAIRGGARRQRPA